jgi:hypothetical protein
MNEYAPQILNSIPQVTAAPTVQQVLDKPIDVKIEPEPAKPTKSRMDFWADQKK